MPHCNLCKSGLLQRMRLFQGEAADSHRGSMRVQAKDGRRLYPIYEGFESLTISHANGGK